MRRDRLVHVCSYYWLLFLESSPMRAAGLQLALVSFSGPPGPLCRARAEPQVSPVRRSQHSPVPPHTLRPCLSILGFLSCLLGHLQQQRRVGSAWCVILLTLLFIGTRSANPSPALWEFPVGFEKLCHYPHQEWRPVLRSLWPAVSRKQQVLLI